MNLCIFFEKGCSTFMIYMFFSSLCYPSLSTSATCRISFVLFAVLTQGLMNYSLSSFFSRMFVC